MQPINAAARRAAKRRRQHEARLKRVAAEEAAASRVLRHPEVTQRLINSAITRKVSSKLQPVKHQAYMSGDLHTFQIMKLRRAVTNEWTEVEKAAHAKAHKDQQLKQQEADRREASARALVRGSDQFVTMCKACAAGAQDWIPEDSCKRHPCADLRAAPDAGYCAPACGSCGGPCGIVLP